MNRSGCCEVNTHELVTSQELTVNKVRIKVNEVIMADDVLFDTTIGGSEVLITFRSSGGAASFMIKSINVQEGRSYDGNTIMLCAEIMPSKL